MAEKLSDKWRKTHPKIAEMLEVDIEERFSSFLFPESHRPGIRMTNGLERLNQEIKRRIRAVRIFPNRGPCLLLISALCIEQSEEWISRQTIPEYGRACGLGGGSFLTGGDINERDLAAVI